MLGYCCLHWGEQAPGPMQPPALLPPRLPATAAAASTQPHLGQSDPQLLLHQDAGDDADEETLQHAVCELNALIDESPVVQQQGGGEGWLGPEGVGAHTAGGVQGEGAAVSLQQLVRQLQETAAMVGGVNNVLEQCL